MTDGGRGIMRHRPYRRALAGRTLAAAGAWTQTVGAGWLVWQITDSALAVAALALLVRGPGLLLAALHRPGAAGGRRRAPALLLVQAATALALAAIGWEGGVELWQLYLAGAVVGNAAALAGRLLESTMDEAVPEPLAAQASGLAAASQNLARLVGPLAGGVAFAAEGPGACFALAALAYVAATVTAAGVTAPTSARREPPGVREVAEQLAADPAGRALLPVAVLLSALIAPVQELAPAIVPRFGDGARVLGLLLAALAAGGLIGGVARWWLVRRQVSDRSAAAGASLVCGGGLLALSAASGLAAALPLLAACGAGWEVVYVTAVARARGAAPGGPQALRLATLGGLAVGTLAMGALFDAAGVGAGMAACGGATLAAGAWLAAGPGALRPARATPGPRR